MMGKNVLRVVFRANVAVCALISASLGDGATVTCRLKGTARGSVEMLVCALSFFSAIAPHYEQFYLSCE